MSTATPPTLEEIEAVFFALAHQARRHIVLLLGHTGGELSSGYLAKRFGHSWPTTTRHLRVLEESGLVAVSRRGRTSNYRLKRDFVQRVLRDWLANLEPVSPKQRWASAGPKSVRDLGQTKKRK